MVIGSSNQKYARRHRFSTGRMALSAGLLVSAGALTIGWTAGAGSTALAAQPTKDGAKDSAAKPAAEDSLILRDGRVIKGKIVSETESSIRFRGPVAGIEVETDYKRSDILEVRRAKAEPADPAKPGPKPKDPKAGEVKPTEIKPAETKPGEAKADASATSDVRSKIYVMELSGEFGRDISQTPIRQAMEDAKKAGSEYVIVVMNSEWSRFGGLQQLDDDAAAFDQLFRAEDMDPIFDVELSKWNKPPKLIFWVKKAMGGASFLPLLCQDIYFHSEGKLGGIGNLTKLFDQGDEVVKQKQYSLRLGHAEGKANEGGYSYKIVRAMAVPEYVLSYTIDGGQVKYLERMPENPNEFLLTDNGEDANQDTDKSVISGEGNDVLTLNAKLAKDLQVAKAIVDTEEDLFFEMGLSRSADKTYGRSKEIMKAWSKNVDQAERDIERLLEETRETRPSGTFDERTRSRGIEKNLWLKIIGILDRYGEALPRTKGLKPVALDRIKSIDNEQQRDLQQQRKK